MMALAVVLLRLGSGVLRRAARLCDRRVCGHAKYDRYPHHLTDNVPASVPRGQLCFLLQEARGPTFALVR